MAELFWSKVNRLGPVPDYAPHLGRCHPWTGFVSRQGYGYFTPNSPRGGSGVRAHRWAYEQVKGPVPDGLVLDHLCRVRSCVNPDHLEPVTIAENCRRGSALKTHCPQGHPYSGENLYVTKQGARSCRECKRVQARAWKAKRKRLDEEIAHLIGETEQETG